jgi:hypothetical protein
MQNQDLPINHSLGNGGSIIIICTLIRKSVNVNPEN